MRQAAEIFSCVLILHCQVEHRMLRPSSDERRAGNLGKLNPKRAEEGRFSQRALRGGMLNLPPTRPEPPAPLNLDQGAGAFHGREAEALNPKP